MDIATLTTFLGWCTAVNLGLLLLWAGAWMTMPEIVFKTQTAFFKMQRAQFEVVFYAFLGLFKIFFLFFNLVPYLVLRLM